MPREKVMGLTQKKFKDIYLLRGKEKAVTII
jgi:hypothetical protein